MGDAKRETETVAVLTVHDAAEMMPQGRRDVADWLRRMAKDLVKYGDDLSGVFRARYLCERRPK